jgi:hypothetical protein
MSTQHSSWAAGWSAFAGIMLGMTGVFHAMAGLVALFDDTFYVAVEGWIFEFDITAWGWIHLIFGIIVVMAGVGIFSGNVLARSLGVAAASLSAIANFAWLPYYPVWSIVMIAIDVAVIWALTVHGNDLAESRA